MCNLPITHLPGDDWDISDYQLEHEGRRYHFGSEVDRWCFQIHPDHDKGHQTIVDRFLAGKILPPTFEGAPQYTGLGPDERGQDAHACRSIEHFRELRSAP